MTQLHHHSFENLFPMVAVKPLPAAQHIGKKSFNIGTAPGRQFGNDPQFDFIVARTKGPKPCVSRRPAAGFFECLQHLTLNTPIGKIEVWQ